jgi:hypothetical protein
VRSTKETACFLKTRDFFEALPGLLLPEHLDSILRLGNIDTRMSSERPLAVLRFSESFHASVSSSKRSRVAPRFALALTDLFIVFPLGQAS